jgi:hypothetical protein
MSPFFRLLPLIVLCFFACKKSDVGPTPQKPPEPVVYPVGQPTGAAISKTIGAEGGSIETPDGAFKLSVPAGAVATATSFSVQPVANTFKEGGPTAYRLLPEGVTFKKPVTVTLSYAGADLTGTVPEMLSLVYQDAEGYFHQASATTVNKTTQKLSVQTTHFSDWTWCEMMNIYADKTALKPGESAVLVLKYYNGYSGNTKLADPRLGRLMEYDVTGSVNGLKWRLAAGSGSIKAAAARCTYKAPARVPAVNPALVSVSVPTLSPVTADFSIETILTIPIAILEDEYVTYTVDGVTHVNEPADELGITMRPSESFSIWANMTSGDGITMLVHGDMAVGSYPFGLDDYEAYIDVRIGEGDPFFSLTHACDMCDETHSPGAISITKMGAVGDYVEGEFSGTVWRQGISGAPGHPITGKFRVKREP